MLERLDKVFSSCGISTRSECQTLIKRGRVTVNGERVKTPSLKVDTSVDIIALDGEVLTLKKFVYIMLNKPLGVVSSTDEGGQTTVVDIIPDSMKREGLFPCGRLDKDTLGLVILTNDGQSAHRRLAPKTHAEKEYIFKTAEVVTEEDISKIEKGVTLKDGYTTMPCKVKLTSETEGVITLVEGKYHEIKRIFGSLGNKITYLKRISFAGICLDESLSDGECRYLTAKEEQLFTK